MIWNQTKLRIVPIQSENGKYNLNTVELKRFRKDYLSVHFYIRLYNKKKIVTRKYCAIRSVQFGIKIDFKPNGRPLGSKPIRKWQIQSDFDLM